MPEPQQTDPWAKYAVTSAPKADDPWAKYAVASPAQAQAETPKSAPSSPTDALSKATGIGPALSTMDRLRAGQVPGLDEFQAGRHSIGQPGQAAFPKQPTFAGRLGQTVGMLTNNPPAQALAGTAAPEMETPLPSTARAGAKFESVAKEMANVPVTLTKSKAAAENAAKIIDLGGKPSKIISDFNKAVGEGNSLSWEDARTLISNASSRSRLSELFEGQTGYARRAIGQFVGELGNEIKSAAQAAGQGEDYGEALKEYRNAMRISRALKASAVIGGAAALKAMTSAGINSAVKTMWSSLE